MAAAVKRFGRLDILVSNAALFRTPVETLPAQFGRLLAVNLRPVLLRQAAARAWGVVAGVITSRTWARCSLARLRFRHLKAGVMLTRGLAAALAPRIQVAQWPRGWSCCRPASARARPAPGARIPMGRSGRPADVAQAVRFFATCSDYVTGQVLFVDGGMSVR
jgi:NAD(P)-dependent dehydrogenase (short-subunit alcohol dehydrogenase family)